MAETNKKIKVDELSYDGIRTNLKSFLSAQDTFKDYNFDGSGLSVLVDLLAYNTHYNALYTNMALNEMFLDSASKRESILSIAKMLGYTPRSARSSTANVTLTVSGLVLDPQLATLPARSVFTANATDGSSYYFSNKDEMTVPLSNGVYTFDSFDIMEGIYQTEQYVYQVGTKFILNNSPCDTSSLEVYVHPSIASAESSLYSLAEDVIALTPESNVYFLKEIEDGNYEIEFGDGIVGKALSIGNYVRIVYRTSSGTDANGSKTFKLDGSLFSNGTVTLTTNSIAMGGENAEELPSIKFNAPRHFSTQNRAVTETDYKNLIFKNFGNVKSIQVWGGEDNVPQQYGKVFISIQPKTKDYLNDNEKDFIKNVILKPKSIVTTFAEIVDPIYLNIILESTVYYNPKSTSKSASSISGYVAEVLNNYSETELMKFDSVFRHSKVVRLIDSADQSIQNNVTNVSLSRELYPKFNITAQYKVDIGNPIYYTGEKESAFVSTGFYIQGSDLVHYLKDNGAGIVYMYYISSGEEIIVKSDIGTVDYTKGIVSIEGLNIIALASDNFMFYFKPSSYDVVALRDQVIRIQQSETKIITVIDPISSGSARGGSAYVFTPNRK